MSDKFKSNQEEYTKSLIEAALFVSDKPLNLTKLQQLLSAKELLSKREITQLLEQLKIDYQHRGVELVKVASGYRFQAKAQYSQALALLFQEKAPKYSRALLETLSLVAYKQPITRGEIEAIRGVAVSSQIMKTLLEQQWVKVIGQKEVAGRPSLYGTTAYFLDHFSLSSLAELPPLTNINAKQKIELS